MHDCSEIIHMTGPCNARAAKPRGGVGERGVVVVAGGAAPLQCVVYECGRHPVALVGRGARGPVAEPPEVVVEVEWRHEWLPFVVVGALRLVASPVLPSEL